MEIFIDTANIEDIKEGLSWGIIDGCTTNPKIVSQEKGINYEEHMKEILKLVKGPVSIEVTTNDKEEMIKEAEKYAAWGENVVIKVPMGVDGLKAVKILSEKGIKTNVTACMTLSQALLAAKAGATYASLFYARMGDLGFDATKVVEDTAKLFNERGFKTKIIIGSIRHVRHIIDCAKAGAHVITIPPKFLEQMAKNLKTDETIKEFLEAWTEFNKVKDEGSSDNN